MQPALPDEKGLKMYKKLTKKPQINKTVRNCIFNHYLV